MRDREGAARRVHCSSIVANRIYSTSQIQVFVKNTIRKALVIGVGYC